MGWSAPHTHYLFNTDDDAWNKLKGFEVHGKIFQIRRGVLLDHCDILAPATVGVKTDTFSFCCALWVAGSRSAVAQHVVLFNWARSHGSTTCRMKRSQCAFPPGSGVRPCCCKGTFERNIPCSAVRNHRWQRQTSALPRFPHIRVCLPACCKGERTFC